MNPYAEFGRYLDTGFWAETSPKVCPCQGRGWFLSDLDSWHRCPVHGEGYPHPESDEPVDEEVVKANLRSLYIGLRNEVAALGFPKGDFNEAVRKVATPQNPEEWVDAATNFLTQIIQFQDTNEIEYFSCEFERRLAERDQEDRWHNSLC